VPIKNWARKGVSQTADVKKAPDGTGYGGDCQSEEGNNAAEIQSARRHMQEEQLFRSLPRRKPVRPPAFMGSQCQQVEDKATFPQGIAI
jgi:hypothetical protein